MIIFFVYFFIASTFPLEQLAIALIPKILHNYKAAYPTPDAAA